MNDSNTSSLLDEVLGLLAPYGPDLRNGLTNHAPMAAEALFALGRAEAVLPWIERYRDGMLPRPPARERISRDGWRAALGATDRTTDWADFIADELAEAPWYHVVTRWASRLAPGYCASAMHGIIRTGHAVRSLAAGETPARRREIAEGLGYWAANYQVLPAAGPAGAAMAARDAIERVPIVPPDERKFSGTIVSSLGALDGFPPFAPVAGLLDVARPVDTILSDLTETFAGVFVANAHDFLTAIVFVHAVTGVSALRSIVPYLPEAEVPNALRHAWQGGAALYAAFADAGPPPAAVEPPRESPETLVDMAIANGDEHAIKFAEACLREWRRNPSPAYLAATRLATSLLVD